MVCICYSNWSNWHLWEVLMTWAEWQQQSSPTNSLRGGRVLSGKGVRRGNSVLCHSLYWAETWVLVLNAWGGLSHTRLAKIITVPATRCFCPLLPGASLSKENTTQSSVGWTNLYSHREETEQDQLRYWMSVFHGQRVPPGSHHREIDLNARFLCHGRRTRPTPGVWGTES